MTSADLIDRDALRKEISGVVEDCCRAIRHHTLSGVIELLESMESEATVKQCIATIVHLKGMLPKPSDEATDFLTRTLQ